MSKAILLISFLVLGATTQAYANSIACYSFENQTSQPVWSNYSFIDQDDGGIIRLDLGGLMKPKHGLSAFIMKNLITIVIRNKDNK